MNHTDQKNSLSLKLGLKVELKIHYMYRPWTILIMTFRIYSIWRHMKVLIDPLDEADEIFSESV